MRIHAPTATEEVDAANNLDDWDTPIEETDTTLDEQPTAEESATAQATTPTPPTPPIATPTDIKAIREAERRCAMAESLVTLRKEDLKSAKEEFDNAVSELRRLVRAIENDADRPLFAAAENQPVAPAEPQPSDPSMAWREFRVEFLDLPASLITKLQESSLSTMGELADYSASGKQLTDLEGVGAAKATKIEDACEKFWRDHPEFTQAAIDALPDQSESSWDEIFKTIDGSENSLQPKLEDKSAWEAGNAASQGNLQPEDSCPVDYSQAEREDFARGYLSFNPESESK